jgi:hypothetical protein
MRARIAIYLVLCLALLSGCLLGCSKAPDPKAEAAKLDRSKIDDEVYQSQKNTSTTTTDGASGSK